jgi:hypothetical protein
MTNESLIVKDLERSRCGLIEVPSWNLLDGPEENHDKSQVRG